jgi:hypothetical protein
MRRNEKYSFSIFLHIMPAFSEKTPILKPFRKSVMHVKNYSMSTISEYVYNIRVCLQLQSELGRSY